MRVGTSRAGPRRSPLWACPYSRSCGYGISRPDWFRSRSPAHGDVGGARRLRLRGHGARSRAGERRRGIGTVLTRCARCGDPYFPLDGNGGYDVSHYDLRREVRPDHRLPLRRGDDPGARHAEPLAFQPRPPGPDGPLDQGRRPLRSLEPRRQRADRHASQGPAQARVLQGRRALQRRPADARGRLRLHPHRRRHSGRGPAARCRDLVPGQRPPDRQGLLHVRDHRAARARGRCERRSPEPPDEARLDDLDVGRAGADGVVPHHGDDRGVRSRRLQARRRSASGTRSTPTCSGRPPSPRTGSQFAISQRGELSYKRLQRTISVPGGGANVYVLGHARHRAQLGLLLRRGAHGRDERLDDAARPERPHVAGHGLRLPLLALPASVPRALPVGQRRRHLRPDRRHRRLARSQRVERGLRAVDGRPLRLRRPERRGLAHVRKRRRLPAPGHLRRRHRRLHRRRLHLVRERREHDGRLDGAGRACRQHRAEPERLDRRHGRGHAASRSAPR